MGSTMAEALLEDFMVLLYIFPFVLQKAMAKLQVSSDEQAVAEGKKAFGAKKTTKQQGEGSDLYKIIRLVMDRSLDPAIVFSFAKK